MHTAQQQKTKGPVKKRAETCIGPASRKDAQMASRCMKINAVPLVTREMQIKTAMKFHLSLAKLAIIKSPQITNAGEGVEKREPSYTVGGNVSLCGPYGK